ncbi:MAG: membrane lipoprotein lipid attachment site-containing protein [Bacteroidales bacterium]|nr:membrane lipoprotein lipid attachment site-containing protein [Candidatus Cacconaster caballi]
MKRIAVLIVAAALLAGCGGPKIAPQVKKYYTDSLEVLTSRCQEVLDAAYMQGTLLETREDLPGWEGYPVQLWEYYTGVDKYINQPKKGLVYMLNPSAEKLAKWIVNAVYDVTGNIEFENVEKIRKFIKWQSGAQFAVAGVVYEDMYEATFYEPYVFKDGITVYVADSLYKAWDKHCTEEQLQYYLHMTNDQCTENSGRYARICSTTREMYYAAGGTADVGYSEDGRRSLAFLAEIARCYQEAWNSDRNFLIYAWAKANI